MLFLLFRHDLHIVGHLRRAGIIYSKLVKCYDTYGDEQQIYNNDRYEHGGCRAPYAAAAAVFYCKLLIYTRKLTGVSSGSLSSGIAEPSNVLTGTSSTSASLVSSSASGTDKPVSLN